MLQTNNDERLQKKKEKQMPEIRFTKEDLLKRKKLTPGWRRMLVKAVSEKPGKNDPESITWPVDLVIVGGPDDGVSLRVIFSEKWLGPVADFIECFIPTGQAASEKTYKLEDTVNKEVMGNCDYNIETGYNTVRAFRAVQAAKAV